MVSRSGLLAVIATVDGLNLHSQSETQKDSPVVRVVKLLENLNTELQNEAAEDEALFRKLTCWCNDGTYEKNGEISASKDKIGDLEHNIAAFTARSAQLKTKIAELEADVAANKKALAEASALREKQLQEFQGVETDNIQAIENLKAALVVLEKHHGGAFLAQLKSDFSFIQVSNWHDKGLEHALDSFMLENDYTNSGPVTLPNGFLQSHGASPIKSDLEVFRKALRLVQMHHSNQYYPSYASQSGEIVGILKTLKEQLEGSTAEAQATERARAAAFADLRAAKVAEIEQGEKMSEIKEDDKAHTDNQLAEAKEDLAAENAALSEAEKFLMNLEATCATSGTNYDQRKAARNEEIKAVSETIAILTADEGRDANSGTYSSFVQMGSSHGVVRKHASTILRHAAASSGNGELSMLATSVELDSFTKVKKAIDNMVAQLKAEQADEVKKNDWCRDSLQENEMVTAKTESAKEDLVAKIDLLASNIDALANEIAAGKSNIAELQTNMQRASEDRKTENHDFQTTIADQTLTIEVLNKALNRLSQYYDQEFLIQTRKQTPPVPQMEYKKNAGGNSVMSMIEKLIQDARGLVAKSKASEQDSQAAYENMVADTNANIAALVSEVTAKTKAKAKAAKARLGAQGDLTDTVNELEGLQNQNNNLHTECDYLQKNFDVRQNARAEEIEALQQAKQVLSGANLS